MKRMFGMIAANEVKIEKKYRDPSGLQVQIQAADGGYSIIFADASAEYADNDLPAKENFEKALERIIELFGDVVEDDSDEEYFFTTEEIAESEDNEEEYNFDKENKFLDAIEKVKNFVYSCADAEATVKDGKNSTISKEYAKAMKEAVDYIQAVGMKNPIKY